MSSPIKLQRCVVPVSCRARNEPSRSLNLHNHIEGPYKVLMVSHLRNYQDYANQPTIGAFSVIVKLQTSRRFVCSSSVLAAINCFLCPGLPWLLSPLRSELILTFAWWPPVPRATLPGPGRPNTCTLSTLSTLRQRNLHTTQNTVFYILLRSYVWATFIHPKPRIYWYISH